MILFYWVNSLDRELEKALVLIMQAELIEEIILLSAAHAWLLLNWR